MSEAGRQTINSKQRLVSMDASTELPDNDAAEMNTSNDHQGDSGELGTQTVSQFVPPDFKFAFLDALDLYASTGSLFDSEDWKSDSNVSPRRNVSNGEASAPPEPVFSSAATNEGNFFKAAKWAPDGSCILSSTNDNCLRLFGL